MPHYGIKRRKGRLARLEPFEVVARLMMMHSLDVLYILSYIDNSDKGEALPI